MRISSSKSAHRIHLAAASGLLILSTAFLVAPLRAQGAPDWPKAAGGKMSFDVASVKLNMDQYGPPNFPLDTGDSFPSNGGVLRAPWASLITFIQFAYKLQLTPNQIQAILSTLPRWVTVDRFDIEARGPGNATKDQMRLMMQSLLADRFKLAVHFDTQRQPIFALLLEKPGKTGPQLVPHSQGPDCTAVPLASEPGKEPTVFPSVCYVLGVHSVEGRYIMVGARNTTMDLIAGALAFMPGEEMVDRPVIDKTGLIGRFDFTLKYTADAPRVDMYGAVEQFDNSQPTFLSALKEQLGLKLDAETGPVNTLIIDRVAEPSPN